MQSIKTINFINITLRELALLEDRSEYYFAFQYSPTFKDPVDHLGIGELIRKPFGLIKDKQETLSRIDGTDEFVSLLAEFAGKTEEQIIDMGVLEFMQTKAYILDQLALIADMEKQTLSRVTTSEEEQAGIDGLAVFGVEIQIEQLCKGEIWQRDKVRATPYHVAFAWLSMWAKRSDYNERLQEIRMRKK